METTINTVTIQGYLGNNPKFKELADQKALATGCIATNQRIQKDGAWTTETTWHDLTFWNKNAHMANDNFKKGDLIKVIGKLSEKEYTNALGETKVFTSIIVEKAYVIKK